MSSTEYIFSAVIAIVFPVFINKLTNKVIVSVDGAHDDENNKRDFHKHVALITVAMTAIFAACFIRTPSVKMGLAMGGIFTLISALSTYWNKYNENMRIAILGGCMLFAALMALNLHRGDDMFSLRY